MEYKYKARFTSTAHIVKNDASLKNEAIASLKSLSGLVPEGMDISPDSDILVIASNLVLCDVSNRNGDCLPNKVAVSMYKTFKNKFLDIEHNRDKIVGFIFNVGFTEAGTNRVLTEEEASKDGILFNVAYAACVWKILNPKLADLLTLVSNEESRFYNAVSSSFEVGFNSYKVAVSTTERLVDAKLFPEDAEVAKLLKCNGGSGKDKDGNFVFRVLDGDVIGLGAGLVSRPASQVEGVLTIEQLLEDTDEEDEDEDEDDTEDDEKEELESSLKEKLNDIPESSAGIQICDLEMKDGTILQKIQVLNKSIFPEYIKLGFVKNIVSSEKLIKNEEKNIQLQKERVNNNITIPMKLENIEQVVASWAELVKSESAASDIKKLFEDAISEASQKHVLELANRDAAVKALEEAKANAEAKVTELQTKVGELATRLNQIEEAKAAAEKEASFQERMNGFDAEFDLSDEERQIIASEIKDLDKDAFEAYAKKAKILMKEKSKAYKAEKAKCMKDKMAEAKVTVKIDEKTLDFTEIVAAVKEEEKKNLPNGIIVPDEGLIAKMKNAFASDNSIKVNGKELNKK
jgi:hypothetical protein